jgi:hypothetical protein
MKICKEGNIINGSKIAVDGIKTEIILKQK